MAIEIDDNIIGFYVNFNMDENDEDKDLIKRLVWGANGLKNKLRFLKWTAYGKDFHLILFQFYVKPENHLLDNLRDIENYRRKEKAIGIPLIVQEDFFKLSDANQQKFIAITIRNKLELLREKIRRNKLDLDMDKLKYDIDKLLS
ncbi:MAG: hypothetical protein JWN83_2462 [Chitinophagaceae bacterium]|nr:hypothetical protein [Chitinophagaceae bacterium]